MNTKTKRMRFSAIVMALAMVMSLFGGISFAPVTAYATNGVSYQEGSWDSTSKSVKFETKTATENVVELQSTTTSWEDGKWYVVPDNGVTISERITVTGTVNLILTDGATLTASKGITVSNSNTLNIFAQSGETGILDATAYYNDDWINDSRTASAAIGGFYDGSTNNSSCGTVNIHGGNINANKSDFSNAAIGGALYGNGGNITIYGGTIKAYGGDNGAGIGAASNDNCSGGTITIYGGSVTAVGGRGNINPGIGAKCGCTEALVSIYGGTVIATGGNAGGPFGPGDGIGFSGRQSTVTYAENSIVLGENVKLYGSSDNTTWSELTSPFSTRYQYMKSETITPATYSVTVAEDITNGTVTADKASAAENDTVTLTVTPAENYEIDSVSYNDGSDHVITPVESVYSFSMPASNVTVTATFKAATPATYTVTFDANGHGTAPSNQTITSGSKASTPTEPTDDGWTFGGWYKEADCTNEWDFDTDTVTADTTLYAKWIENANNTETLLTTITPTGKSTYSETSTEVATVTQDCYTYNSQYGWLWFESGSVTVAANEGYTITKCVFIQNAKTPITISTSPYAIHFERGGVTENSSSGMDGVTSIEVYGYATTTATTYSVTVADSIANGTVTADKASAAENDTVTLTVTPAENYEIDSVSYNDGSDHVITPVESVYSFSMPASNVTVSATFKAATCPTLLYK